MELSKYFAVFFALGLVLVPAVSVADETDEAKKIKYFSLVFGDASYKINDVQMEHPLKNGSERTVTYAIGTTLCVTSETGLLVLKDSENTEYYVNKASGCHTVRAVKTPTLLQKVSRYIPEKITEGEASVSGLTLFSASSQEDETASVSNLADEDFEVTISPSGSLSVLSKVWKAKDGAAPIQLQIIGVKGELLLEQLSNTPEFTYFATPANMLPQLQNASLIVFDKSGNQLTHIKMNKGADANWIYTVQD
jgi:hypothetical protein